MRTTLGYGSLLCSLLLTPLLSTGCGPGPSAQTGVSQGAGYTSETTDVRPATFTRYQSEINEMGRSNRARIVLKDGEQMTGENLRLQSDSAFCRTDFGLQLSVATPKISCITVTAPGAGTKVMYSFKHGDVDWSRTAEADDSDPLTSTSSTEPPATTNRTETQEIDSVDTLPDTRETTASRFVDAEIPTTSIQRPDDIAVVIGNTEYTNEDLPNVDYAVRIARVLKRYFTRTLGFREENIIYVENASGSAVTRIFGTASVPRSLASRLGETEEIQRLRVLPRPRCTESRIWKCVPPPIERELPLPERLFGESAV